MSDLGLNLPHFEFLSLYLGMFDQNWSFLHKNEDFDQIYLSKGSKTQNVEKFSLDLIFAGKIAKVLVTESDRNQSKLTVWHHMYNLTRWI